jgi:hypothetical protein
MCQISLLQKTDPKFPFLSKYSCCNKKEWAYVWPFNSTISICRTSLETEPLHRTQAHNERKYITQRGGLSICFRRKKGRGEERRGGKKKRDAVSQSSLTAL